MWTPGSQLSVDLNSKPTKHLERVLNSDFWRQGHQSYVSEVFPSPESKVYATVVGGTFQFYGLPNTAAHLSQCFCCSTQFESGEMISLKMISSVLKTQTALLSGDTCDAQQHVVSTGGSGQHDPVTQDLPCSGDPAPTKIRNVLEDQGGGYSKIAAKKSSNKPPNNADVYSEQFYGQIMQKFNTIESVVGALSSITLWVRKKTRTSQVHQM